MIFLELFLTFFKIGAFTFGGGYAMLPLVQEAVLQNGWLGLEEVINFIAVSESTPGPFAINMATYVGNQMGGVFGAFCATLGVVLPSFIIILVVAKCFDKFKNSHSVKGIMSGLKPAVVGLIASAVLSIGKTVFVSSTVYGAIGIFLVSLVMAFKKVHPIIIILITAVLGIIFGITFGI